MPVVVVVGAQWGDEGKGKVVDLYTRYASAVVRYGGGANAGHTLVAEGEKVVLHLVPSGALHRHTKCILGQGTVIDPRTLVKEIDQLDARGLIDENRFTVSDRAHVVLPHHMLIDGLREGGAQAIGTTKRGIGPAYEDKVGRRGVRIGDLLRPESFARKLDASLEAWKPIIVALGGALPARDEVIAEYMRVAERLRPFVRDATRVVHDAIKRNDCILLEGAQGALLDIDHGTYPYVTSSSVIAGGACTGTGLGPTMIDRVLGITKAYATRVGSGPFPTELHDALGDRLRDVGSEYGATTGRARRCGWLDIPALRHAVRINGIEELAVTKLDVLTGLTELRVCVAYELDGEKMEDVPFEGFERVTPVYETLPGWNETLDTIRDRNQLPENARRYLARIEELAECAIGLVSVGPDREATIGLTDPFKR